MISFSDIEIFLKEAISNGSHKGISNRFYNKIIKFRTIKSICTQDAVGKSVISLINKVVEDENLHLCFLNFAKCFCESLLYHRYFKTIKLIKSNVTPDLKYEVLTYRCYDDLKIFDYACEDDGLVEYACNYCSPHTLKKLVNHKSPEVRSVVYKRLGPRFTIDNMLKDSLKKNRLRALELSPMHNDNLFSLINDRSLDVVLEVLLKVSDRDLPYFFKYLKNNDSWQSDEIKRQLKKRMSKIK